MSALPEQDKAEWVADLRSGEFRPGLRRLCQIEAGRATYCPLGVYAERLYRRGKLTKHGPYSTSNALPPFYRYGAGTGSSGVLPREMHVDTFRFPFTTRDAIRGPDVTWLNDVARLTHAQMADMIEHFL